MYQLMLVFLSVVIGSSYGDFSMYQLDPQDAIACAMAQGITAELLQGISYGKPEELYDQLPEARCFLACVLRKMGQFVGDADTPVIKDLQEKFSAIPNLDFEAAVADCRTKPGDLDDGTCMREYKAFTCFAEKLQQVAKSLEEENLGESGVSETPEGWEPGMGWIDGEGDKPAKEEEEIKVEDTKKTELKVEDTKKAEKQVDDTKKAEKKVDDTKKAEKKVDATKKADAKKDDEKKKTEL